MTVADPILVTRPDGLAEALSVARAEGRVGIDCEFLRERTYRARICLVQIAAGGRIWLIDPLEGVDLAEVAGLIGDPAVRVVLHAGRQDLELFHDGWGAVPANVFDVQIAAGFAGYGASLPYGRVVEATVGANLKKGEAYTDWCRRPLTDAQVRYAADDVRFLLAIEDRLVEELERLGRVQWAYEEMRSLEDAATYASEPAEAWRRVSGRGSLTAKQTAVLREVAAWREETAAERDIPRGWVVKDPTLIEIARRAPTTTGALKGVRGLHPREVERSGRAIVRAVEKGLASPPLATAPTLAAYALVRGRALSGLADALVRARCDKARIATELVSTRGELEALIADVSAGGADESRHRLLRGWRRELAGDAVLKLVAGELAISATEKAPYIEETTTSRD